MEFFFKRSDGVYGQIIGVTLQQLDQMLTGQGFTYSIVTKLEYLANLPVVPVLPSDPAGILASERTSANFELLTNTAPNAKLVRAVVLVMLDEINLIRSLLVPTQAARTAAQLKTAIQAKINSGAAD